MKKGLFTKVVSLLLAVVMVAGMVPSGLIRLDSFAAVSGGGGTKPGNSHVTVPGDSQSGGSIKAVVVGSFMRVTVVQLLDSYDGTPVTTVDEFKNNMTVQNLKGKYHTYTLDIPLRNDNIDGYASGDDSFWDSRITSVDSQDVLSAKTNAFGYAMEGYAPDGSSYKEDYNSNSDITTNEKRRTVNSYLSPRLDGNDAMWSSESKKTVTGTWIDQLLPIDKYDELVSRDGFDTYWPALKGGDVWNKGSIFGTNGTGTSFSWNLPDKDVSSDPAIQIALEDAVAAEKNDFTTGRFNAVFEQIIDWVGRYGYDENGNTRVNVPELYQTMISGIASGTGTYRIIFEPGYVFRYTDVPENPCLAATARDVAAIFLCKGGASVQDGISNYAKGLKLFQFSRLGRGLAGLMYDAADGFRPYWLENGEPAAYVIPNSVIGDNADPVFVTVHNSSDTGLDTEATWKYFGYKNGTIDVGKPFYCSIGTLTNLFFGHRAVQGGSGFAQYTLADERFGKRPLAIGMETLSPYTAPMSFNTNFTYTLTKKVTITQAFSDGHAQKAPAYSSTTPPAHFEVTVKAPVQLGDTKFYIGRNIPVNFYSHSNSQQTRLINNALTPMSYENGVMTYHGYIYDTLVGNAFSDMENRVNGIFDDDKIMLSAGSYGDEYAGRINDYYADFKSNKFGDNPDLKEYEEVYQLPPIWVKNDRTDSGTITIEAREGRYNDLTQTFYPYAAGNGYSEQNQNENGFFPQWLGTRIRSGIGIANDFTYNGNISWSDDANYSHVYQAEMGLTTATYPDRTTSPNVVFENHNRFLDIAKRVENTTGADIKDILGDRAIDDNGTLVYPFDVSMPSAGLNGTKSLYVTYIGNAVEDHVSVWQGNTQVSAIKGYNETGNDSELVSPYTSWRIDANGSGINFQVRMPDGKSVRISGMADGSVIGVAEKGYDGKEITNKDGTKCWSYVEAQTQWLTGNAAPTRWMYSGGTINVSDLTFKDGSDPEYIPVNGIGSRREVNGGHYGAVRRNEAGEIEESEMPFSGNKDDLDGYHWVNVGPGMPSRYVITNKFSGTMLTRLDKFEIVKLYEGDGFTDDQAAMFYIEFKNLIPVNVTDKDTYAYTVYGYNKDTGAAEGDILYRGQLSPDKDFEAVLDLRNLKALQTYKNANTGKRDFIITVFMPEVHFSKTQDNQRLAYRIIETNANYNGVKTTATVTPLFVKNGNVESGTPVEYFAYRNFLRSTVSDDANDLVPAPVDFSVEPHKLNDLWHTFEGGDASTNNAYEGSDVGSSFNQYMYMYHSPDVYGNLHFAKVEDELWFYTEDGKGSWPSSYANSCVMTPWGSWPGTSSGYSVEYGDGCIGVSRVTFTNTLLTTKFDVGTFGVELVGAGDVGEEQAHGQFNIDIDYITNEWGQLLDWEKEVFVLNRKIGHRAPISWYVSNGFGTGRQGSAGSTIGGWLVAKQGNQRYGYSVLLDALLTEGEGFVYRNMGKGFHGVVFGANDTIPYSEEYQQPDTKNHEIIYRESGSVPSAASLGTQAVGSSLNNLVAEHHLPYAYLKTIDKTYHDWYTESADHRTAASDENMDHDAMKNKFTAAAEATLGSNGSGIQYYVLNTQKDPVGYAYRIRESNANTEGYVSSVFTTDSKNGIGLTTDAGTLVTEAHVKNYKRSFDVTDCRFVNSFQLNYYGLIVPTNLFIDANPVNDGRTAATNVAGGGRRFVSGSLNPCITFVNDKDFANVILDVNMNGKEIWGGTSTGNKQDVEISSPDSEANHIWDDQLLWYDGINYSKTLGAIAVQKPNTPNRTILEPVYTFDGKPDKRLVNMDNGFTEGSVVLPSEYVNGTATTSFTAIDADGKSVTIKAKAKGVYDAASGGTKITNVNYTPKHSGTTTLYVQWEFTISDVVDPDAPPPTGDYEMNTIYWDQNYDGGGITSSIVGKYLTYCDHDCQWDEDGNHTGDIHSPLWVAFHAGKPNDPTRPGFAFRGWNVDAYADDAGAVNFNSSNANGTTYYGIWNPDKVVWNANGGTFESGATLTWDPDCLHPDQRVPVPGETGNGNGSNLTPLWNGGVQRTTKEPKRTGYTFNGWYVDPACSQPADLVEEGAMPGRTYYAGWTPDRVFVNYYDTREGTSLITTQEYKYDDLLNRLIDVESTDGWTSMGWYTAEKNGTIIGNDTQLNKAKANLKEHNRPAGTTDPDGTTENKYWTLDVFAHWRQEFAEYTVQLDFGQANETHWSDFSNNDGIRPKEITVGLRNQYGRVVDSKTVQTNGNADVYTTTFDRLPITTGDSSTEEMSYYVFMQSWKDVNDKVREVKDTSATSGQMVVGTNSEDDDVFGLYNYGIQLYRTDGSQIQATGNLSSMNVERSYQGRISFDHDLITTGDDIKFTIQWDDDSDRDNLRPDAVTLILYANKEPVSTKTPNSGEYQTDSGVVSVQPGICDVSDDGNTWTYTFKDFQRYTNKGEAIQYTVQVVDSMTRNPSIAEYTIACVSGGNNNVFGDANGVIISHDLKSHPVKGSVIWEDELNRDGKRPESVDVTLWGYQWNQDLYQWERKTIATQTVTGGSTAASWSVDFGSQLDNSGGQPIVYRMEVTSNLNAHLDAGSNEYNWTEGIIGRGNPDPITVRIYHNTDLRSVDATIDWRDVQNNDGIRPKNVVLQLYAVDPTEKDAKPVPVGKDGYLVDNAKDYRVTLSGDMTADTWNYTFENLPRFAPNKNGVELVYSVRVEETEDKENLIYGYYIITDNGKQEEILRYKDSYLTADNTLTNDADLSSMPYVRMEHILRTQTMSFFVNWHDDDNRDGIRPDEIAVDMYKTVNDGTPVYQRTLTLTHGEYGTWSVTLPGLAGYENGQKVKYTIEVPDDVKAQLESVGYTTTTQDNIVHLYYTPETGSISTELYWTDMENKDGYRPDGLMVELYANGVATGKTVELNKVNGWKATWTDLPVNYVTKEGKTANIVYSVQVTAPEGYNEPVYSPATMTIPEGQTIYITLTHDEDLKDFPVYLHWNDESNQDGLRPTKVRVTLLADNKLIGRSQVLDMAEGNVLDETDSTGNTWTYTFKDLPVYAADGHAINYSVILQDDTAWMKDYQSMTAESHMYLYHGVATSNMYVSFQFNDNNNANGDRPTALYLSLKANGDPVDDSRYKHTVSFDTNVDGYTWTFGALPVYSTNGDKIRYSVEIEFDDRFGATDYKIEATKEIMLNVSNDATVNQVIVKLSKDIETADQSGRLVWFDLANRFGDRPEEVTVVVTNTHTNTNTQYLVNVKTGDVINKTTRKVAGHVTELPATSPRYTTWEYTINDLPFSYWSNISGQSEPIYYYTTTNLGAAIGNYTILLDGEFTGLDATMQHIYYKDYADTAVQNHAVTILWDDNADAWGYRPNSNGVKVEIVRQTTDGEKVEASYVFTEENALITNPNQWQHLFRELPTFVDGGAVQYKARVTGANGYIQEVLINTDDMTTIRMSQVIGFDFRVNWNDSDNDDGFRPETLGLDIFADGNKVKTVTLTGEGNIWTGNTGDLNVWRTTDADKPVAYSFRWNDETEDYLTRKGYTAKASNNGEELTGSKTFYWLSVDKFGDNTLEGYDELAGTYDWETTLSYDRELADYSFSIRFDDNNDQDGIRPVSGPVIIDLLANGEVVDSTEVVVNNEDSEYGIMFERKPVKEDGEPVVYTITVRDEKAYTENGYAVSYNENKTAATFTHVPETIDVDMSIIWDDSSEMHEVYNSLNGKLAYTYYQILRRDVNLELYADGEALTRINVPSTYYGTGNNKIPSKTETVVSLPKYRDHGTVIKYTMDIVDSPNFESLFDMGYVVNHTDRGEYDLAMTVSRDYFNVTGTAWYMYTGNNDFLLKNQPVTIYRQENGENRAVATTTTDDDGRFMFRNLPNGQYIVRATYVYGGNTLAGTVGAEVDRKNIDVTVLVNRDAGNDGDFYLYTSTGHAYYQTDKNDPKTITAVGEGSVVLLFRVNDTTREPEYVGMTTVGKNGAYSFGGLEPADYLVNVMFNYDGGAYTFDNGDALALGLSFRIVGADAEWPDIIKQVNKAGVTPIDPDKPDPDIPDPEEPEVTNCIVSGNVFYEENGVHTTDPVEGVGVYLYTQDDNMEVGRTVTDANGAWSLKKVPVGAYTAVFSYKGNASRVLLFTVSDGEFETGSKTVDPQYFEREVTLPTGTIRGVVLDEEGNTMRVLVAIYDMDHLDKDGQPTLSDFAYTDTYGYYQFNVVAGYDYNVRILAVENKVTDIQAGVVGDGVTTLDHFEVSGNWTLPGLRKEGTLVAVYEQQNGEWKMVNAGLTDETGRYEIPVERAGNYMVCPYVNSEIYDRFYVSVGLDGNLPVSTYAINGTWTLSGNDSYDSYKLYRTSGNINRLEASGGAGEGYSFENLQAGTYRIELTKGTETVVYYTAAPTNLQVELGYDVVIDGYVRDAAGNNINGATVVLKDQFGNQMGKSVLTTLTDAHYHWDNLPKGEYHVVITAPNSTKELGSKMTTETDSYGNAYPNGMGADREWVWNMNALRVTGVVADQYGEPIADAMVVFKVMGADQQYVSMTDTDGRYNMAVAPGKYAINCYYDWDANHRFNGSSLGYQEMTEDMLACDFTVIRNVMTLKAVRAADETPAPNADIKVFFEDGTLFWQGKADENGEVELKLFQGAYKAEAVYDGSRGVNSRFVSEDKGEAIIRIDSVSYITGKVTGVDGQPVADGIVHYDNGNGFKGTVRTDDDGMYTIAVSSGDLGQFELYAQYDVYVGKPVTVTIRADRRVDLRVEADEPAETTYTITGAVIDEDGNRLANADVTMRWGNDKANVATTSTDSNGNYVFTVEPGTYYLTAEYLADNGNVYETNNERAVHVIANDVTDADLLVLMNYTVTVTVLDIDGNIVPGAKVIWSGAANGSEIADENGVVEQKLPAGDYRFYATTESRSSLPMDKTIIGNESFDIILDNVGIRSDPPEVEGNGIKIYGYVFNPKGYPVENVDVTLWKFNVDTEEYEAVETKVSDTEGYYEFPGLDVAVYKVTYTVPHETTIITEPDGYIIRGDLVSESGNPMMDCRVELFNGEDLVTTIESTGTDGFYEFEIEGSEGDWHVVIHDGGDEPVDVPVQPEPKETRNVISGVVTDVAGHIVSGATVVITNEAGDVILSTTTDETGEYSVDVSETGTYTVSIEMPTEYDVDAYDYNRDTEDRNAPYIQPTVYTIKGVVMDDDGKPVEGAIVILKDSEMNEVDRMTTEADGKYLFTVEKDGIYYVEVIWNGNTEREYEVNVENGDSSDVTVDPSINVTVTNFTLDGEVVEPAYGWKTGLNTFRVNSDKPCVVLLNHNGELTALTGNVYHEFTAEMAEGDEIVVALVGDANLDGEINGIDPTYVMRYLVGTYTSDYEQYVAYTMDANHDGEINGIDPTYIMRALVGTYEFSW